MIGRIVNVYGNNEFLIDSTISYVSAINNQEFPSIAFDGTNYLIVWEDERNGSVDIYGARVSQSGVVLDPLGIVISNASDDQKSPSVAFNGTNYLVVWQDYRNGTWDIYGARITQSGVILDSIGISISNAVIDQAYPSITFDGSNYLVVWHDTRNGPANIYCARVTQSGFVLDLSGIPITTANYWQEYPSVAFDGSNYLVVWEDGRSNWDIYGARVTTSGVVLDSTGIRISTAPYWQWAPSVAFDGTNYLVVWEDLRNGPDNSEIYGARVDQNGLVLDPIGIAISTALYWQSSPSVIFNGTYYLVVWDDERSGWHSDIYGARVNQSGIILDPDGIVISNASNEQKSSIVAFDGNNYLSVWQDYRNGAWDIYSTRISSSGIVLDSNGIAISTVANEQLASSIAFDGTNYLVVWQGKSDHSYDIYGLRVNDSGITMDSTRIAISTTLKNEQYPSVIFDGTNYLVTWEDYRNNDTISDIYGARVDQYGIVLDSAGIAISTAPNSQNYASLAFDGTNFLIVWEDERNGSADIYGARVSQSGVVLDPTGIVISTALNSQKTPSVAFDGTNYLVVWEDKRRGASDIYGTRISQSGTILDPEGFYIIRAVYFWQEFPFPSVTFDGSNYLVVWEDDRNINSDIYGARVNQSGIVIDTNGFSITNASNDQKYPSVAFDGTNYLVVWQDYRNNDTISDIYGARIMPSGLVVDSFAVSLQPGNQFFPALAHGYLNNMLITYSGWTDSINTHPVKTLRLWGKFYPFVGIDEESSTLKAESFTPKIYPNPAKSFFTIRLPQITDRQMFKIFDVSGKLIKEIASALPHNDRAEDVKISLKGINPGIYFLRFGKETKKFLVVK